MGDFWDGVDKQYGLASSKPTSYSLPTTPAATGPLPTLSDPRTAGWMRNSLESARQRILGATRTGEGRNNALNAEGGNLHSGLVQNGFMSEQQLYDWLTQVAHESGLHVDSNCGPAGIDATIKSSFKAGLKYGPRPPSRIPRTEPNVHEVAHLPALNGTPAFVPPVNGNGNGVGHRKFRLVDPGEIADKLPTWAWRYNEKGRIMLGTLALFAGRPGAGKSTAARWFASLISRGELEGCWFGQPQLVTYIAPAEESLEYMIKPGLRAADANFSFLRFHEVLGEDDKPTQLLSALDEENIVNELIQANCRVVVVDPVMSTISSMTDINKNNEVRAFVEPWSRIADRINGIVIGVVHMRKNDKGDVVSAITGSSAFGEVARAVFGFAKDPESDDGDRVMSQHKNSAGDEDLAVVYRIKTVDVHLDSGEFGGVGRFELIGDSSMTVEDVLSGESGAGSGSSAVGEAQMWLEDYLTASGATLAADVLKAAGKTHAERTLRRAAKKLRVHKSYRGFPRAVYWELPKEEGHLDFSEPEHGMDDED